MVAASGTGFALPPAASAAARAAAAHFQRLGLPTPRAEAWKYTNLRGLGAVDFAPAAPSSAPLPDLPVLASLPGLPRLVFVNGHHRPDLSNVAPGPAGPGAPALARPERDAFAALNTMFATPSPIVVPPGHDAGTVLRLSLTLAGSDPIAAHPRQSLTLGAGARLTLLDVSAGTGAYLHNEVLEIALGAGAHLTHLRLQEGSAAAFAITTLYADLAEGAGYDALSFTLGAALSRTEAHVALSGAKARFTFEAAQALTAHQHGDITTVLAHDAPQGRSRQTIRNVLAQSARGVFQGRIDVARAAQKTDGYQMNHALLLSANAEIDSKPELRINADDVKCSHGATVGELDADQIFYLRSRGIPEPEARAMLIRGFLAEPLAAIAEAPIRAVFDDALARALTGLTA